MKRLVRLFALCACLVLCLGLLGCELLNIHKFDEWEVQVEPTCSSDGEEIRKCLNCEHSETRSVDAFGHALGDWVEAIPSTCQSEGTLGYYKCSVCDKYFDKNKTEIPEIVEEKKAHRMAKWETRLAPTCEKEGEEIRSCVDCGHSEIRRLEKLEHTFGAWIEPVASTCQSKGILGHYECSACGKYFDESNTEIPSVIVEQKEHDFKVNVCRSCGGSKKRSEGLEFTDKGDHYVVSGIGSCTDKEIFIPCVYNGKNVTEIEKEAFYNCRTIEKITISAGITTIGENAFKYCFGLKTVILPKGITEIANAAFSTCADLEKIDIPEGVKSIGDDAFIDCRKLKSVTIPEGVTSIGKMAFYMCTSLKSITLPDSVTSVGHGAFAECTSLESAVLSNGLTNIPTLMFDKCTSLTNITLPESLTSIGNNAFSDCTKLASIKIPNSVKTIDNCAFKNCTSLANINLPTALTTIGTEAFSGCAFTSVSLSRTEGWHVLQTNGRKSMLKKTDLAKPETVAKYLTKTYSDCFWLFE